MLTFLIAILIACLLSLTRASQIKRKLYPLLECHFFYELLAFWYFPYSNWLELLCINCINDFSHTWHFPLNLSFEEIPHGVSWHTEFNKCINIYVCIQNQQCLLFWFCFGCYASKASMSSQFIWNLYWLKLWEGSTASWLSQSSLNMFYVHYFCGLLTGIN